MDIKIGDVFHSEISKDMFLVRSFYESRVVVESMNRRCRVILDTGEFISKCKRLPYCRTKLGKHLLRLHGFSI